LEVPFVCSSWKEGDNYIIYYKCCKQENYLVFAPNHIYEMPPQDF
jgi:hypothetical protein